MTEQMLNLNGYREMIASDVKIVSRNVDIFQDYCQSMLSLGILNVISVPMFFVVLIDKPVP